MKLKTTTPSRWIGRMTPLERAMGRYLRSEDGHPAAPAEAAPDAPPAAVADPAPAEPPADPAPADTILGGKPEGEAAKEGEPAPEGEGDKVEGDEPQPYADLTPPEGFEALDTDALAAATPLMRKFGVADDQAQDFINEAAPVIKGMLEKAAAAGAAAQEAQQNQIRADWANELKADKDFGGANYEKTVARAAAGLDKFFAPEFREFLNATGLGNHPEMVRGFAKIGEHFGEGEVIVGEPGEGRKAHPLYDEAFLPPEQRQG